VEHGLVPATLHHAEPNPRIDFASSPFFVNTALHPWPGDGRTPRRAGVSSFGIGGTNAHVVLEQAPPRPRSAPARDWHLLPLSARTPAALEAATDRLAEHLRAHPEQPLADVAYTLQVGRRAWEHRRVLVARDRGEAADALASRAPDALFQAAAPEGPRPVAFLFPGLGNHYPGMGLGLYRGEPAFRRTVDRCAEILRPRLGLDLREVLYPPDAPDGEAGASAGIDLRAMLGRTDGRPVEGVDPAERLNRTRMAQVALFVTEYALARLWMEWGVRPEAMIGHSLGEYVAATVAGVWSLEDALMLVAERARLIDGLPEGGMMGVTLPEAEVRPLLRDGLCVATLNGPSITVVSGPAAAVDALQVEMTARGVFWRRVNTRHAFHSTMMEPVAERLEELMRGVRLGAPAIPFVSNVTGTWIRPDEATDPAYWTRHLCGPVRFSEGAATLCAGGRAVLVEVGPGQALRTLVRQLPCWDDGGPPSVASLRHAYERRADVAGLLGAAGRLWALGVAVDWKAVHAHERLRRVPLPTYPFERRRCWIEPGDAAPARPRGGDPLRKKPDPADWLYLPTWTRAPVPASPGLEPTEWLVLADAAGIGAGLAGRLESFGHRVAVAEPGERFAGAGGLRYVARPGSAEDLAALRDALHAAGMRPRRIVHLWGIDPAGESAPDALHRAHARGHATVAALARTFARDRDGERLRLVVVTEGAQDVAGGEAVRPERAALAGACLALPQEHPHAACRVVDVRLPADGAGRLVEQLLAEVAADSPEPVAALRGPLRWARSYQAVRPPEGASLRPGGAWLFSGALAAGGDVLAEHLAGAPGARIAFLVDPAFPRRDAWDARLASAAGHDAVASTIRGIRAAEALGCRTLLLHAAPGDAAAVAAAVAAVREAFGELHGVVHSVRLGAAAELAALADARPGDDAADLARVAGELDALEAATAGLALELRLLQNSLFSVLGGAGVGRATAVCALVDAWAQRQASRGGQPWTSVSWDRWHMDAADDAGAGDALAERAILRGEGARVFDRLAALAGEPRVAVSTCELAARVERLGAPPRPAARRAADPDPPLQAEPRAGRVLHAPTSEAEEIVARLWSELLGVPDIGIHDDFFELGGHSLLGMQVLSRVREVFQVELPLRAVFEGPTVAGLVGLIDEAILARLDGMTEEEAAAALAGLSLPAGSATLARG
jgi:acyl transferase domain-containing protein